MKWPPSWAPAWLARPAPDVAAQEAAARRAEDSLQTLRALRDARTRAGLSFADVERDTRINRVYIEAIEDGRFEALPAPVYARGFARSYARYLGLDPEEAAAAVPRDLPAPAGLEPMPGLRRTVTPVLPAINPPVVIAIAVAVALVVAAVILVPRLGGPDGLDDPRATGTGTATSTAVAAATIPPFEEGEAPDFTGVSREEAEQVIEDIGATPLIVEAAANAPAGTVFAQTPEPGGELGPGSVMTLFVAQ
ncbi:MAG: helix-turn-helix domain-containing protein [Dehalococcoidia bacterium]